MTALTRSELETVCVKFTVKINRACPHMFQSSNWKVQINIEIVRILD